jgi:hypothetical protein
MLSTSCANAIFISLNNDLHDKRRADQPLWTSRCTIVVRVYAAAHHRRALDSWRANRPDLDERTGTAGGLC